MRCFSEKTLQEYLDGEVSDTQRPRIEQHLARCSGCSHKLAGLSAAKSKALEKLALLDPPEIPAPPVIRARETGAKRPQAHSFAWLLGKTVRLPLAAAAMAALFVAGLGLGLYLRGHGAVRPVLGSRAKSIPFYILSDKAIRTVPLDLDLADYKPIAQPQVIITQEETR